MPDLSRKGRLVLVLAPLLLAPLAGCGGANPTDSQAANLIAGKSNGYQQMVAYSQCMRSHAIPMLDPDAQGILNLGNVPGIAGVGRYTPQFRHADHVCRSLLPAGVADNGTGP